MQEMTALLNENTISTMIDLFYELKARLGGSLSVDRVQKIDAAIAEFEGMKLHCATLNFNCINERAKTIAKSLELPEDPSVKQLLDNMFDHMMKKRFSKLTLDEMAALSWDRVLQMTPSQLLVPSFLENGIRMLELYVSSISNLVKENQVQATLVSQFSEWLAVNKAKLPDMKISEIVDLAKPYKDNSDVFELSANIALKREQLVPPAFLAFFDRSMEEKIKADIVAERARLQAIEAARAADSLTTVDAVDDDSMEEEVRMAEETERQAKLAYDAAQKITENLRSKLSASKLGTTRLSSARP